jgi:PleD family two-component response regulator
METNRGKRLIIAGVDDIFFSAKIESVAKRLGFTLVQALDAGALKRAISDHVPDLVILDLNSEACDPLQAVRLIRADKRLQATGVVGFFSHVQTDLEGAAREAGLETILPRSKFSRDLADILSGKP